MDARTIALRTLGDLREGRRTARQTLDLLINQYNLPDRDAALASELVHGVVRHRLTLAAILSHFTRDRWQDIARRLKQVLMLGAYQIIWLDSIPAFAAVYEAVNQAKADGGAGPARFVNAVLRELERKIEQRRIPRAQADPMRAIPIDLQTCCQFAAAILPDPAKRYIEHLSQATSHPSWLVSRWTDAYGPEQTKQICLAGMLRPPMIVRPNLLMTSVRDLMKRLDAEGFEPQLTAGGDLIVLGQSAHLGKSALLRDGFFQPQDPTSMLPVRRMNLKAGQTVLDLCAGLGTKTTQMVEVMGETSRIIATDLDEMKLTSLQESTQRLGYKMVETVPMAELPTQVSQLDRLDWILIDAPCSNTGVLARRPEIRYRLAARSLPQVANTQLAILQQATDLARPETRLMYSTCSIDPEENEQVCSLFLEARPDWQYVESSLTLPNPGPESRNWHDGGFWAIFARRTQ